jgi:hypothetical protein
MKLIRNVFYGAGLIALLAAPAARADIATNAAPDFREVYDLVRSHLAGESETDLNRAAVQGLLNQLHAKVWMDAGKAETNSASGGPFLAKSSLYDGPIAFLRVGRVGEGLANEVTAALKSLTTSTNRLKGVVFDLRYADGHDYAAAAAVADLFTSHDMPLLDWGNGFVRSTAKSDAINLPIAILVNQQTAAAAEALAAVLRANDRGVILGANTAGEATVGKEYPLRNGQYLRIATASVKLGDGEMLSANGLKPDIHVEVRPEDERIYFADPFKEAPSSNPMAATGNGSRTNATNRVMRTTEADLIRERKERPGADLEFSASTASARESEPEKPVVRDPALGRALDLIKGIAALRANVSN